MKISDDDWLKAMKEIRELRIALRLAENKLGVTQGAAVSTITTITDSFEVLDMFHRKQQEGYAQLERSHD